MKLAKIAVIAALLATQTAHAAQSAQSGQSRRTDAELNAMIDEAIDDSVQSTKTQADIRLMSISRLRLETESLLSQISHAEGRVEATKSSRNIKLVITAGLGALAVRAATRPDYRGGDLASGFAAMFKVVKVLAIGGTALIPGTLAATDQIFISIDSKEIGKLKARLVEIRSELSKREAALK